MNKNIIAYILTIGVLFFLGLYTHSYFLEKEELRVQFSLQKIYFFYAIFALIVCVAFQILSKTEKIFQQLGFIYLGVLVFKIVFFSMVFYNPIFTAEDLSKTERISLLIPIAIFLFVEVYFIAKILNRK